MIKKTFFYSCLLLFFFTFSSFSKKEKSPDLMLAKIYADNIDVTQYWVSEKLDGVRAHWDGKQLISRGGKVFEYQGFLFSGAIRFLILIIFFCFSSSP